MKALMVGVLVVAVVVPGVAFAQAGAIDMSAVSRNVIASIERADQLLMKEQRDEAVNELKKTATYLYEEAKASGVAGQVVLTGVGQEVELTAFRVQQGGQKSLEQLKKLSDYQLNVAYRLASAEYAMMQEDMKSAQSELQHAGSYLGETANGVGQQMKEELLDAKSDIESLSATLAEGTLGTVEASSGVLARVSERLENLFLRGGKQN